MPQSSISEPLLDNPSIRALTEYTASNGLLVRCYRTADEMRHLLKAWAGLAEAAVEANPSYEPWALVPALTAFDRSGEWLFVFIFKPAVEHLG
jgi:hypothetical protein